MAKIEPSLASCTEMKAKHASRPGCLIKLEIVIVFSILTAALALENGVGRTPAMGWNSWNYFRCNINETIIRQVVDAIVSSGLKDAGYVYVNIDDCWMEKRDPVTGRIQPFKDKFPSGMKALGDYIHSLGLRFGIYSDTGNHTCEGYPGSWGHEKLDAATYAEWGVDYLKYDYCGMEGVRESVQASYERMRDALAAAGRPVLFSLCSWGSGEPWLWGSKVGNSWRTGIDVFAAWDTAQARSLHLPSFLQPILGAVRQTQGLADHAGPGGFNDPDMLVVGLDGMYPYGIVQECPEHVRGCKPGEYISRDRWGKVGGLTQTEQRTHFSFWCMMAAPLILGNDPRVMSKAALQILLAREVLAVNQDPLGAQGRPVWRDPAQQLEVWVKPLADGRVALLLVNLGNVTTDVTTDFSRDLPELSQPWLREVSNPDPDCKDKHNSCKDWAKAGECKKNSGFMFETCPYSCPEGCPHAVEPPGPKATALVRDLWLEEDVGVFTAHFTAHKVEPHEARMVTFKWVELSDAARLTANLDFGPRALTNSLRAAATALKLTLPPADKANAATGGSGSSSIKGVGGGGGGDDPAAASSRRLFLRSKELETEVQRLHSQLREREREIAKLQKQADEVQCDTAGHHSTTTTTASISDTGSNNEDGDGFEDTARRSAIAAGGSPPVVWLSWTESKVSVALNLALAAALALAVAQLPRRHMKTRRDLQ